MQIVTFISSQNTGINIPVEDLMQYPDSYLARKHRFNRRSILRVSNMDTRNLKLIAHFYKKGYWLNYYMLMYAPDFTFDFLGLPATPMMDRNNSIDEDCILCSGCVLCDSNRVSSINGRFDNKPFVIIKTFEDNRNDSDEMLR